MGAINFFQTIFIARTEDNKSANYVLELPGRVRGDGGEGWGLEWARVFSDGVGNVEVRLNTATVDVVTVKTALLTFSLSLSLSSLETHDGKNSCFIPERPKYQNAANAQRATLVSVRENTKALSLSLPTKGTPRKTKTVCLP